MIPIISLLIILTLSLVITRVATVALTHTGLSHQAARFQARSAFTGVGFTTTESERVVNHPVRRRVLMLLMLLGNAGIATSMTSMILAFIDTGQSGSYFWLEVALLIAGIALLWMAAMSRWLDRRMSRIISFLLDKYTRMEVTDYASLLRVGGAYTITEIPVEDVSWLAGKTLAQLRLREEGIVVLGVQADSGEYLGVPTGKTKVQRGDTLLCYGQEEALQAVAKRESDYQGEQQHEQAVAEHQRAVNQQKQQEAETGHTPASPDKPPAPTTPDDDDED
jgi:K+/H+ antiporter YhaU regulatory subunit KhtT